MAHAPSVGITLPDRYRLDGHVAAGGMATVYAAHDTVLDRPVAVKVLAEHLSADVAARKRFQREARAAAALSSHPGVVTVFDVGEHEGRSFIVMELRRGGTIGEAMQRDGAIRPERALAWLREAAAALDAAHEAGVVHRDIKPANLLLDEHGRVAVADFGIARLAWEQQVTQTGQVLGTASYLSPEQAEGHPATPASDRYALAVVAFELLTGAKPFQAEHFAAQARAHIEDPPPRASMRAPELPPAVDAVLERGMAKDPDARWPSACAFVDALAGALTKPRREPTAPTRPVAARPRRSGSAAMLVAIVALLIIAVVAIVGAATSGDDPRRQAQEPRRTPAAESTPDRTPEPTVTADATNAPGPATSSDPSELNAQGFELIQAGDYGGAVPVLQKAVEACGDSAALDPCAYATYNLGVALSRSGNPADAIPLLEARLERWPGDQRGTVKKELKAACKATGRKC